MDKIKVLAVILNYMTYDMTLNLIAQLNTINTNNIYMSVMVVDNCSPNESAEVLKQKASEDNFIFYANDKNSGYAAGNNIGIRYAAKNEFKYSWILNNDVKITDTDILNKLVSKAEESESIGGVGPKIINTDGSVTSPYVDKPSFTDMSFGILFYRNHRKNVSNISQKVYRLHGCCMLLKNSIMEKINYMDERTFLYLEEEILAERMDRAGAYMFYMAEAEITHFGSATINKIHKKGNKHRIRTRMASMEIYLKDYRKFSLPKRLICKYRRYVIMKVRG